MHFGLQEHLTTIRRHMGKIALIMLVSTMLTGAVGFMSSKVYVSQSRVLLLNSSPAERASRPSSTDLRVGFSSPQDQVLTQVEILQSPALAEKLVIKLGPERVLDEMTWRWDWLRELPSQLKDDIISKLYGFALTRQVLDTIGIREPIAGVAGGPPIEAARDKIIKGLRAEGIVKTDLFGVAFAAPSAEFAAEALNGMIDTYIEHMVELRRPLDTAAIAQKEAERLESSLGEAEGSLRKFSKEFDILSIERQKDLLLDRWSRMQEELSRAEGSLLETLSKIAVLERDISTLPRQEAISLTTRPNPIVDRLRERLVQVQAELQRYVVGSDAAVRLRREIDTISAQIVEEAKAVNGQETVGSSALYLQLTNLATLEAAEKEALDARIIFLTKEFEAIDTELRRVVSHELEYRQLARNVEAREEAYRYALLKREETAIQASIAQSSLAQVVPVERGDVPSAAAGPRRLRLVALGLIAGLLSGIGLAYFLEFTRRTISTIKEAELASGLPVLSVSERFGLFSKRLKSTRFAIRRFAVWVARQHVPDRGVRLLFTAAHGKTGQSLFVKELATSLQKQGMDVLTLLLDPNGRSNAKVSYKSTSDKASGQRSMVVTVRAPAWEMSRSLQELLSQLGKPPEPPAVFTPQDGDEEAPVTEPKKEEGVADLPADCVVIIDAPSFQRFPELGSLAEFADRAIPVVEADRTKTSEMQDLLETVRRMEVDLPGIILTKRRMKKSSWAFGWSASTQRKMWEKSQS